MPAELIIQDAALLDSSSVKQLLRHNENKICEFKETFNGCTTEERNDTKNYHPDKDIIAHHMVLRAVASFSNTVGGYVAIGVQDGEPPKIIQVYLMTSIRVRMITSCV
jgi:predicted HTH transcriptional regulator